MSTGDSNDMVSAGERQRIWDEVHEYTKRRAVIEQARGMLMLVYDIDADEAFDVLRSHSQERNVKLGLVAEQIQKDLVELATIKGPARELGFDRAMRTAVTPPAQRRD